jgi:hypothetical protein
MYTKTSFKRIALVAASALAIAGFSAVPAHAAHEITLNTLSTTSATTLQVEIASAATFTFTHAFTAAAALDDAIVTVERTLAPAGATANKTGIVLTAGTTTGGTSTRTAAVTTAAPYVTNVKTVAGGAFTTTTTVSFTPDVVGKYTLRVQETAGAVGTIAAAATNLTFTIIATAPDATILSTSLNLSEATTNTDVTGSSIAVNLGALMVAGVTPGTIGSRTQFTGYISSYPAGGFVAIAPHIGTCGTDAITIGADYDGGNPDTLTRSYDGIIPNVRLYSRPLTAAEVLQNFNATRATYGV